MSSELENEHDDEIECRICRDCDAAGELIRPCLCSGTMRFVHRECLAKWWEQAPKKDAALRCEQCLYVYKFVGGTSVSRAWGPLILKLIERTCKVAYFVAIYYFHVSLWVFPDNATLSDGLETKSLSDGCSRCDLRCNFPLKASFANYMLVASLTTSLVVGISGFLAWALIMMFVIGQDAFLAVPAMLFCGRFFWLLFGALKIETQCPAVAFSACLLLAQQLYSCISFGFMGCMVYLFYSKCWAYGKNKVGNANIPFMVEN